MRDSEQPTHLRLYKTPKTTTNKDKVDKNLYKLLKLTAAGLLLGLILRFSAKKMTMDTESGSAHPVEPPLKRSDKFFILFMICMVCIVTWVGYLSYQKGQLEETTKRNGEAWLQWLSEAATHRHEAGFQPEACAAQLPPTSQRWQNCYQSLTAADGPLGPQRNPFSGHQVQRAVKCDSQDRQLAGSLVFEKITPTPPGSAIPTLMTALLDSDSIGEKIQIRISVCDSGSNPIRIGELEF